MIKTAITALLIDNSITRNYGFENDNKLKMGGNVLISTIAWATIAAVGVLFAASITAYATGTAFTFAFTTENAVGGAAALATGLYFLAHKSPDQVDGSQGSGSDLSHASNSNKQSA